MEGAVLINAARVICKTAMAKTVFIAPSKRTKHVANLSSNSQTTGRCGKNWKKQEPNVLGHYLILQSPVINLQLF